MVKPIKRRTEEELFIMSTPSLDEIAKMDKIIRRYIEEPRFNALVDTMYACFASGDFTDADLSDALSLTLKQIQHRKSALGAINAKENNHVEP